ncbi:MAG: toll/interleukin-1 receptor domain-containing protein [Chloroflexi bacterium]|nr:toll/interleukin-1 receptor domain-containing protein [Chloroflexota bacterium]
MGYVFVRYARPDKRFAEQLSDDLEQAGVDVWRGIEEIAPGQNWGEAIRAAIAQADAVVYISSRGSMNSKLMLSDLEIAQENGVTVFPVVRDFPGFRAMPKQLYGIDWLDVRKGYAGVLESLLERLPADTRQNEPVVRKSAQSRGYVFISYAEEDTAFVQRLRQFLMEHDYSYWDYQESNRDYHTQLFLELEDVIREAVATLSVLSPDWKRSPWTPKELIFSEQVQTPVFLLHVREMEPTLLTAGVPYIDFVNDEPGGFRKLEAELRRKGLL